MCGTLGGHAKMCNDHAIIPKLFKQAPICLGK